MTMDLTVFRGMTQEAQALAMASVSRATRRAYKGALRRLSDALSGDPLTDESLAEYLSSCHSRGLAPASAALVVAAVRFYFKVRGEASPAGPATERVLTGIRRDGRERGRGQVAGIRWETADAITEATAAGGTITEIRDAAIIAVMSDAALRVGECSALLVSDFTIDADGSGRILIRFSKTDQEGRGDVHYLGESTVRRIRAWLETANIEDGPMFRRIFNRVTVGAKKLTGRAIRDIIKNRASMVEGRVSGHSLRVGSALSLVRAGASLVDLQRAGRWATPSMPGRYTRSELAAQGAVARLRHGAGS